MYGWYTRTRTRKLSFGLRLKSPDTLRAISTERRIVTIKLYKTHKQSKWQPVYSRKFSRNYLLVNYGRIYGCTQAIKMAAACERLVGLYLCFFCHFIVFVRQFHWLNIFR